MSHASLKDEFIYTALRFCVVFAVLIPLIPQTLFSQICGTPGKDGSGNISGVINTYYPSPSTANASGTSIPVGAVDNLESGLTAISPGDLIIIFQTQNASINTSNSANYGSGTGTGNGTTSNNAGFYEYAVATNSVSVAGGTITVSSALTRTYSGDSSITTTRGKRTYQVIRVPQYYDVSISGTVHAAKWDGKSGGLVVMDVAGNLNMGSGIISAAGKGFRGGLGRTLSGGTGSSTDYVSLSTAGNNGSKGEGIVGTPRFVWDGSIGVDTGIEGYPSGTYARGAPGNAGGGGTDGNPTGNTQNSGGGGGGNGGVGGIGGNSWSSNLAIGGIGGATFPAGVTRVSLGGGGGAGTSNNGSETTSSGASGGGVVLIRTGSVSGTGTVNVDGSAAPNANPSCCDDGAGGGGAGGSIVITATNTSGLAGITGYARGGRGGNTLGSAGDHGPGGGGGGGIILSNAAISSSSSVSGGSNGLTGTAVFGATAGSNGSVNSTITASSIPGTSPGISCSSNLSITKSSNGPWTIAQSSAQYTLTVTNSGSVTTSGTITAKDTLPTGISPNWTGTRTVSNSGLTWSCTFSGQDITCTTSNGLSNSSGSNASQITLPVNVTVSAAIGTNSITNYASVAGANDPYNTGITPPANSSCTDATHCTNNSTTILSPDLTISKSHIGSFVRGSSGIYTLTVSNSPGTAAASGTITILDTLPSGLSVNGGAAGAVVLGGTDAANWTCNSTATTSQTISCTSTTSIAISGSAVFTFSVDVALAAASTEINSAAVSGGSEATANNGNNSTTDPTTTIAGPPSISLVKSCISPADCISVAQLPGTDITYKIEFTNSGGQAAAGLIVIDGVPSNMDYKVGSAVTNLGTTGLTVLIEFSSDFDPLNPSAATWSYTPISTGGGASLGYDRIVKAVRWRVTAGSLSQTSPNNVGDVSFVAKIQ